ncbi:tetratricopeptide repeat protein [Entomomonas moraniae]|uniref:Tetratricopeptide repeat protein n=1 Tax=Entomomonas moraniae TaxID=2213226 RepID=A0A451EPD2_9GAMM|nr:tetratricopeptide repeat protein [Entomomonas moraniae]AZS51656.1 tetratricopeptide repeat protein [Entomomonas moraniae]
MSVKLKRIALAFSTIVVLSGCGTNQPDSIPVVDASSPLSNKPNPLEKNTTPVSSPSKNEAVAQAIPQGVDEDVQPAAVHDSSALPTGIPVSNNGGGAPLDDAVLALLTTAQQQKDAGNLNEAAASAERAQRIAPSEPRVLYMLSVIRLQQGDAEVAEQLARRALSYTTDGQAELKSNLWEVVAQARDKQGDQVGADQARQQKTTSI